MIDITGLREDKRPQSSTIVHALLDRLEAAESDALEQARLNGMGSEREAALMAKLEAAEKERDKLKELNSALYTNSNSQVIHNARLAEENYALRSKIATMEKQEPVAIVDYKRGSCIRWVEYLGWQKIKDGAKLYALPGAKGE